MSYYTRKPDARPASDGKSFAPKVNPDTYNPMVDVEFVNPNIIIWEWRNGLIQNASDAIIRYIYWAVILANKHERKFDKSATHIANRFGNGMSGDAVHSALRRTKLLERGGKIGERLSQRPWQLTNSCNQNAPIPINGGKKYLGQIDNPPLSLRQPPIVNLTTGHGQFDNSISIEPIEDKIEDVLNQNGLRPKSSSSSSFSSMDVGNKSEAIGSAGSARLSELSGKPLPNLNAKTRGSFSGSFSGFANGSNSGDANGSGDLPVVGSFDSFATGYIDSSGKQSPEISLADSGYSVNGPVDTSDTCDTPNQSFFEELAPQIWDRKDLRKVFSGCITLGVPITAEILSAYICVADVAKLINRGLQVAPPHCIQAVISVSRLFAPYTSELLLSDWETRFATVISQAGQIQPIYESDWLPDVEDIVSELLERRSAGSQLLRS